VAIGIYAVMSVFLYKRPFGTYLYAIGGSEETSIASGINVRSIKTRVYVLNGLFASIAGIILASRLGSANPSQGIGLELDGIAAAVLGGTSLSGGKGRVWGVFFGAVTMSILRNGLNMVGLPMALQVIVVGLILIAILSFDTLREIS
jgi:ribose/xylose/arabinose/galactoside ABC-type transport system permease subunit